VHRVLYCIFQEEKRISLAPFESKKKEGILTKSAPTIL